MRLTWRLRNLSRGLGMATEVLNQLSEPQRVVAQVLTDRWGEVKEACPDSEGEVCEVTGRTCSFRNCPKLESKGSGGSETEKE